MNTLRKLKNVIFFPNSERVYFSFRFSKVFSLIYVEGSKGCQVPIKMSEKSVNKGKLVSKFHEKKFRYEVTWGHPGSNMFKLLLY